MEFRSSNQGFCSPKDIQSNVGSSHGVQLSGGSTGGVVQPCGDDANISLFLRGKGTGGVTVGNSSSPVTIGAGSAFKGAYSTTAAWTIAALSSGATAEVTFASTTADVVPGDLVMLDAGLPAVSTQTITLLGFRMHADASSRITATFGNITSTAVGSTASGTMRITWIDLT
jgi:hypothetical protein